MKRHLITFSLISIFLIAHNFVVNAQSSSSDNWADELIQLRSSYQSGNGQQDHNQIINQFCKDFPWEGYSIIKKINHWKFKDWLSGKDENKAIEVLYHSTYKQIEEYSGIFKDQLNRMEKLSGENKLKHQLLLIADFIHFKRALNEYKANKFENLEKAISDIESRYPSQYNGKKFRAEIARLKKEQKEVQQQLNKYSKNATERLTAYNIKYDAIRKKALLSNPLVTAAPIVFVTRQQYAPDHHNSATLFHTNEINTNSFAPGSSMKIIDLKNGGKVNTLFETKEGVVRDPEIRYDGKKILFSMRKNIQEDYHIYEMDIDGSNMKQLTAAEGVADIDPQYLPDGDIVFTSTREPKYCMCNIHIMGNIFKMEPDGANITQLGKSTLFEGHSTILPDGRILYDRWEYVDRNFGDAQGLWTMNPDGTNQAIYFGNNSKSPGGYIDARPIPGTDKVISILGSCHDRAWGALGIINRKKGMDAKEAVEMTWPAYAHDLIGKGNWDTFKQVKTLYEDPFPLNDTYFLCSRSIGLGEQMGLYLIDIFGNEQLIYTEAPGCYNPVPIKSHKKELVIQDKRDFKSKTGKFYVQDVYRGTHMEGVKRGAVKYLRVVESVEKRSWTVPAWKGQGVHRPAMNWHSFECKKIWGIVPVEEDGSAYVEVPADKYVYFQLLDENKQMIQSMRSGTMVHSGETMGCIGCHDDRRMAPPSSTAQVPKALELPPRQLNGWYGEPRTFGFMKEVQPVLDNHCVKCHDFGKDAGEKLLLAGDRNPYFNAAYIDMHMKKAIKPVGAGPAEIQQAYSWGSHPSKIIKMIKSGHYNVKLTSEEMERITTWLDLNAVYYPDFISAYPDNTVGRSPISEKDLNRLGELTKVNFSQLNGFRRKLGPQISFDRPSLSPCLKNIKDKNSSEYNEALSIISKGKEQLAQTPRLDMEGFVPSPTDQKRLDKYLHRQQEEMKNRQAIQKGKKRFDKGVGIEN